MGEKRNAYKILMGKVEGKRPLSKPRSICEGNIQRSLKKWAGRAWQISISLRLGKSCGFL
jgi:hypothetical protein